MMRFILVVQLIFLPLFGILQLTLGKALFDHNLQLLDFGYNIGDFLHFENSLVTVPTPRTVMYNNSIYNRLLLNIL